MSSTQSFPSDPFTMLILSLVLGLSGLFLSLICVALIRADLRARKWPIVEGQITASRTANMSPNVPAARMALKPGRIRRKTRHKHIHTP